MFQKIFILFSLMILSVFADGLGDAPDSVMHPNPRFPKVSSKSSSAEKTRDYWINQAKAAVSQRLALKPNERRAKNVIMFLGDGMSHASLAAARVVLGDESKKLSFEEFPYTASSKTYCVDAQVADSACTATAYLQGVKTNNAIIGLTSAAKFGNCNDQNIPSKRTYSIAKWFQDQNKSTGVVTTTTITHATPAGVYANVAHRDWEVNANVQASGCDDSVTDDIAEQLVYGAVGSKLKVALGGGSSFFVNKTTVEHGVNGRRTDGKNLINEWLALKAGRQFVRNRSQLMAVDASKVDQLFGLFHTMHMEYNLDVISRNLQSVQPTLTEMAVKALDVVSKDKNGYFLLVEGGKIDHGHHFAQTRMAVDELIEFHKAIQAVVNKVDLDETLIVVTADHGHVFSMAGYPQRGSDIFGTTGFKGDDGLEFFTSSYANGPGFYKHRGPNGRVDPKSFQQTNSFQFPSTVPTYVETHGGDDVGIWAIGPHAHEFKGVIEQNVIAHLMAYAACVGKYAEDCQH